MTLQNPELQELLPLAGADCPARRRLTKTKEEETIIINRSGRSTYPEEKSVSRSGATPIRELRQLRDENTRLKRLVAELTLDKHILGEVVRKKL